MSKTFKAIYYDEFNHFYNATIFISSVTLTMRYRNENGQDIDRYWLGENIVSLEENELQSALIYKNESGRPERLVIRDPELLQQIKYHFRHRKFAGKRFYLSSGKTRYRIIMILMMILLFLGCVYFFFVPWLGERVAMKFSKEKEISLGNQMYTSLASGLMIDNRKTKILNNFYRELNYKIDYPIEITVVKSDEVNAFAIPGGHIVVFDGILDQMKTPEQLAALLSHEGSHIQLRHSLRNIFRSMARKMFLLIILGGDAGIAGYLADRADDLKGLQYSRALETEADESGMTLMYQSGVNTEGMLQLMELLKKEGTGRETSALLSTHPVFESRIKNIRKNLGKLGNNPERNPRLVRLFHEIYESGSSY
jgi:Zn-dependent protease with chaperone function